MVGIEPKRLDLQEHSTGFPELIKRTLSLPGPTRSLPFVGHFVSHSRAIAIAAGLLSNALELFIDDKPDGIIGDATAPQPSAEHRRFCSGRMVNGELVVPRRPGFHSQSR